LSIISRVANRAATTKILRWGKIILRRANKINNNSENFKGVRLLLGRASSPLVAGLVAKTDYVTLEIGDENISVERQALC